MLGINAPVSSYLSEAARSESEIKRPLQPGSQPARPQSIPPLNSKLAAISAFPPVASNNLFASSLPTPRLMMLVIASSACPGAACEPGWGAGVAGWGAGAGVEASVWPGPGKGGAAAELEAAVEEIEAMGAEGGGIGFPCLRR